MACLNIINFLLTLSAYYSPIRQIVVFAPSVVAIYCFTAVTEYILLVRPIRFKRILQICLDVARERKVPWSEDLTPPYIQGEQLPPLLSITGLVLVLTGMWLFLWMRRRRWAPASWEMRRQAGDESHIRQRATQFHNHSKTEWSVGICAMLISLTLAVLAVLQLGEIMGQRRAMILISDGRTGENSWSFGQIVAVFAWAPLVVDIGCGVLDGCKKTTVSNNSIPSFIA